MENAQAIALMMGLAFAGLVIGVCLDLYRHRKSVTRDTAAAPDAVVTDTPVARNKGGRPKGSKNKPKAKTKKTTRRRA
jgi:hypothetical protein